MRNMLFLVLVIILLFSGCAGRLDSAPTASEPPAVAASGAPAEETAAAATASGTVSGQVDITLNYLHRSGIASNQFVVWIEDSDGSFIKTLFVTRFTASGGWKSRPDALPVWVSRSGLSGGTAPAADATSGATPKSGQLAFAWDCTDKDGQPVPAGEYHFLVEGTIFWKDAVLYEGVITVGSGESTAQAEASHTTEEAKKSDMITGVEAVYSPK